MSEPQPSLAPRHSDKETLLFIVILSFICAVVLSVLASALEKPQEDARDLYRSKQMLIAARVLNPTEGYFQIRNEEGKYVPAELNSEGILVPSKNEEKATDGEILDMYRKRIRPFLLDPQNKLTTFQDAGIDPSTYLTSYRKTGYYKEKYKLLYEILPNKATFTGNEKPDGFVIPVNGFGLWDAIYGYLAIAPDGVTVIGISWYEQKETPGLGANIAEPDWQSHFFGKKIFQPSPDGKIDVNTAPIGITVVKGKVSEVIGDKPKAESAVDGMAGATLTGNGVTEAYDSVLSAYRTFFIEQHNKYAEKKS